MNKFEKFENAIHLGPVKSKADIPVYAHMCTYAAVPAGVTQKDLFSSNDAWLDATFISPDTFEEFCWPNLKKMIEAFHAKGVTAVIHADGDWLLQLPFFKEVPKGSCILELDGATDIVKAKEILNGYQCIRGDLPATVLAFEDETATQKYCDKLIDLAMDGGFIVGTGCEVPLNAKVENMRVFLNCCKE